ncbi:MAG: glycoside hydrolase family 26 protein [Treponema sp.]|nr:glycoside hydrolase family 26 protein [Treponema sp.]
MKYKTIIQLPVLALALLLAGCNLLNGTDKQEASPGNVSQVTVSIGTSARTILPDLAAGFSKFEISAGPAAGNAQSAPAPVTVDNGTQGVISLQHGEWDITITGYVNVGGTDYTAATGSAALTVDSSSHSVRVLVNIPETGGTGTFAYTVTFPEDGSNSVNVRLDPWPVTGAPVFTETVAASGTPVTQSVPSGIYFLTVTANVNAKTIIRNEIVHIYPHLISNASYKFNGTVSGKSPNAQRLMNYLEDQFGVNIISGQQDNDYWLGVNMVGDVYRDTGKWPAMKGFDLMQISRPGNPYYGGQQQIDEAINWWNGVNEHEWNRISTVMLPGQPDIHGIITFCWHWRAGPNKYTRDDSYNANATTFRIPWSDGSWNTSSPEYTEMMNDIDTAAELFKQLQALDIPVLWRPLHEGRGHGWPPTWSGADWTQAWFWWGNSGPAPYKALWALMYDRFTNHHGLDNLIWVWNGEHPSYFPDDPSTVDIAGIDIYLNRWPYFHPGDPDIISGGQYANLADPSNPNYTNPDDRGRKAQFDHVFNMVPASERARMIVAITENGYIPHPDDCFGSGATWSFFMTWGVDFWWEDHNTLDHRQSVYNHPRVITLEDLPDLTTYRLY